MARHRGIRLDRAIAAHAKPGAQRALTQVALRPVEPPVTAQTLALKAAAAAARPVDAHLHDRTLRRGDIVATTAGLRVFLGSEQFPYRVRDFVSVSVARHVAQRADLEALDRSLRGVRIASVAVQQKRVARAAYRVGSGSDRTVRRVEAQPGPAMTQTATLAYAPRADANVKSDSPAIRAIDRVIRRVDAPPPTLRVIETVSFAVGARAPPSKNE